MPERGRERRMTVAIKKKKWSGLELFKKVTFEQRLDGELHIQILKKGHLREKGNPMQEQESKNIAGKFKQYQESQYTWREVLEQKSSRIWCQRGNTGWAGRWMDYTYTFDCSENFGFYSEWNEVYYRVLRNEAMWSDLHSKRTTLLC